MHRYGHYGAGLLAYAPVGFVALVAGFPTVAVGGALASVGLAMVPDWDMRIPGIKHRGVTHTVHFAAAVGALTGMLGLGLAAFAEDPTAFVVVGAAVFGATTGAVAILAHIGADALTPMGVWPLGDDGPHISYGVCRADSTLGNYALLAVGGGLALAAFGIGLEIQAAVGA
jgi:inner membrane protein